jgi:heme-degrading monooxygenase HmoA
MSGRQFVMASRLRLTSVRHLPRFLRASMRVDAQAKAAPGRIESRLHAQLPARTFWTLSVWETEDAMRRFVRTAPHADVMRDLGRRGMIASAEFRSWEQPAGAGLPSWEDVAARFSGSTERRPVEAVDRRERGDRAPAQLGDAIDGVTDRDQRGDGV